LGVFVTDICSDILCCKDLFVVLSNVNGKFDYLESYRLTNILYSDNKYWGKFSNVHPAVGHDKLYSNQALSYAYNNFSSVVCTSGLVSRTKRFISSKIYKTMDFKVKGKFVEIWSMTNGGDIHSLKDAVKSGCRMKVKIESLDNYTYILNLHTIEVDVTKNVFCAESEYDGYPDELRHFQQITDIERLFNEAQKERGIPAPSTGYYQNSDFFLTSFKIYRDKTLLRFIDKEGNVNQRDFNAKEITIWKEAETVQ